MKDLFSFLVGVRQVLGMHPNKKSFLLLLTYAKIRFKNWLSRHFKLNFKSEDFFGYSISLIDYSSFAYLFEEIFIYNIYEFTANSADPFIVDGGSNIGMSIIYHKWKHPKSRIIGFEPDPNLFDVLCSNVRNNFGDSVQIYNHALGNSSGQIRFFRSSQRDDLSLVGSLTQSKGLTEQTLATLAPLSNYLDTTVDFLKLDVEGSECDVIKDLFKSKKLDLISNMTIEYHHNLRDPSTLLEIVESLSKSTFQFCFGTNRLRPRDPMSLDCFRCPQDVMIYAAKGPPAPTQNEVSPDPKC